MDLMRASNAARYLAENRRALMAFSPA
jgi:hypothetical protein